MAMITPPTSLNSVQWADLYATLKEYLRKSKYSTVISDQSRLFVNQIVLPLDCDFFEGKFPDIYLWIPRV